MIYLGFIFNGANTCCTHTPHNKCHHHGYNCTSDTTPPNQTWISAGQLEIIFPLAKVALKVRWALPTSTPSTTNTALLATCSVDREARTCTDAGLQRGVGINKNQSGYSQIKDNINKTNLQAKSVSILLIMVSKVLLEIKLTIKMLKLHHLWLHHH